MFPYRSLHHCYEQGLSCWSAVAVHYQTELLLFKQDAYTSADFQGHKMNSSSSVEETLIGTFASNVRVHSKDLIRGHTWSSWRLQKPDLGWDLVVQKVVERGETYIVLRVTTVSGKAKPYVRFLYSIRSPRMEEVPSVLNRGTPSQKLVSDIIFKERMDKTLSLVVTFTVYCQEDRQMQNAELLSADMGRLLADGPHSDVELKIGVAETEEQELGSHAKVEDQDLGAVPAVVRAHKAVLAARSPFFRRLFQSDMSEVRDDTVAVRFSAPVFDKVLRYMYTGSAGDLDGCEMDVLAAADYYDLEGLKRACEELVLQRVPQLGGQPGVLLDLLVQADRLRAGDLKAGILEYAAENVKRVKACQEWEDFRRLHFHLVDEIMDTMAAKLERLPLRPS